MKIAQPYRPEPAYTALGDDDGAPFYDPVAPASFPKTILRYRNQRWADAVGLAGLGDDDWIAHFARFEPLPDNIPAPFAIRYHGHQFRSYNPDIGDGRGFLFAQLRDGDDRLLDLATKGSGRTPYSRFGDGRLTLKGGVREILATEMLEALGVYTSKSFSLVETGEALERNDEPSPTRSSVLVRLGHSHVRFGVFQRLAAEQDRDGLAALVDYCIRHFDADLAAVPQGEQAARFFARVSRRSARLAAQWMAAGFVHGVLNTDNMNVTGESFDYGPWRFLPVMDPGFTAAYFDQTGLYAYGRQPEAVLWNLSRLGGALLPLADEDALNDVLQGYPRIFENAMADAFFARLGIARSDDADADFKLVADLMRWMQETGVAFERVFFDWFGAAASSARRENSPLAAPYRDAAFADIAARLTAQTPDRPERLEAEYFQQEKPCTMLIDEVESLWAAIADDDDWAPLTQKLTDIETMRTAFGFSQEFAAPGA